MSIQTAKVLFPHTITNEFFSLHITKHSRNVAIVMESLTTFLTTYDMPHITNLATEYIPDIFLTDCFNYDNAPFSEEIKNTEVAHLFEHILLTVLYSMQAKRGNISASYNGVTTWNWQKEKRGIFHITISLWNDDFSLFPIALKKSIDILERLYQAFETQKIQTIN
jgi:hypothetical protein